MQTRIIKHEYSAVKGHHMSLCLDTVFIPCVRSSFAVWKVFVCSRPIFLVFLWLNSICFNLYLTFKLKIRRWADKFRLHCNIFIYIRHIWIKPVLCSRMVYLFHHTSPWTHRCLQASPSAHRNGRVFKRSVQTACCYWILNRGKSSSNWNSQTNASRLWWSVCWCEYSKRLGKVKSVVRKGFQKQNTNFFKDGFKKKNLVQRWRKCIEVRGDFIEK